MECQSKQCADIIESGIRKERVAREDVKIYRKTVLRLCGGDMDKFFKECDKTMEEIYRLTKGE